MKWTLDQALTNWRNAFDSGHLTAARAWWAIVQEHMVKEQSESQRDYSEMLTVGAALRRAA